MILLTRGRAFLAVLTLAAICCGSSGAQESRRGFYAPPAAGSYHPVFAEHGMVVAQEKLAAQIGADILRQGGNAVDAAVATGFALAVTYPRAGNIGGGGFMIIHSADAKEDVAIDYRETAPAATTRDLFLGTDGKPDIAKSRDSALSIGVPGTVAGLALALEKYGSGTLTLAEILKPAIALARDGVVIRRQRRHAAGLAQATREMAVLGKDFFPRGRLFAARRRYTDAGRSGEDAVGDIGARPARVLRGSGGGKAGQCRSRCRRHHDADDLKSYQAVIRAPCAAVIAATTSSRCRSPPPAAWCCWRR